MSRLAYIFESDGLLYVGVPAGFDEYIVLRTRSDLLELLRDLIAAGNAHFGTTARLIEASGELNAGKFLSADDFPAVASAPDDNPGGYTWADFRREHLAQFEAMVAALPVSCETLTVADLLKDIVDVPGMTYTYGMLDLQKDLQQLGHKVYTWAEFQAANQQALDDIAAFVGGKRE